MQTFGFMFEFSLKKPKVRFTFHLKSVYLDKN